jgi:hypothetical protein
MRCVARVSFSSAEALERDRVSLLRRRYNCRSCGDFAWRAREVFFIFLDVDPFQGTFAPSLAARL